MGCWARLEVVTDGVVTKSIDLESTQHRLGRHGSNHTVFPWSFLSGQHCQFITAKEEENTPDGGVVWKGYVKDTSTNGTYVNGALVGKGNTIELMDNDQIIVSKVQAHSQDSNKGTVFKFHRVLIPKTRNNRKIELSQAVSNDEIVEAVGSRDTQSSAGTPGNSDSLALLQRLRNQNTKLRVSLDAAEMERDEIRRKLKSEHQGELKAAAEKLEQATSTHNRNIREITEKLRATKEELKARNEDIDDYKEETKLLKESVALFQKEIETLKEGEIMKKKVMQELELEHNAVIKAQSDLKETCVSFERKLAEARIEKDEAMNRIKELELRLNHQQEVAQKFEKGLRDSVSACDKLKTELREAQRECSTKKNDATVAQGKATQFQELAGKLRSQLVTAQTKLQQERRLHVETSKTLKRVQEQHQQISEELSDLRKAKASGSTELTEVKTTVDSAKSQIQCLEEKVSNLMSGRNSLTRQLDEMAEEKSLMQHKMGAMNKMLDELMIFFQRGQSLTGAIKQHIEIGQNTQDMVSDCSGGIDAGGLSATQVAYSPSSERQRGFATQEEQSLLGDESNIGTPESSLRIDQNQNSVRKRSRMVAEMMEGTDSPGEPQDRRKLPRTADQRESTKVDGKSMDDSGNVKGDVQMVDDSGNVKGDVQMVDDSGNVKDDAQVTGESGGDTKNDAQGTDESDNAKDKAADESDNAKGKDTLVKEMDNSEMDTDSNSDSDSIQATSNVSKTESNLKDPDSVTNVVTPGGETADNGADATNNVSASGTDAGMIVKAGISAKTLVTGDETAIASKGDDLSESSKTSSNVELDLLKTRNETKVSSDGVQANNNPLVVQADEPPEQSETPGIVNGTKPKEDLNIGESSHNRSSDTSAKDSKLPVPLVAPALSNLKQEISTSVADDPASEQGKELARNTSLVSVASVDVAATQGVTQSVAVDTTSPIANKGSTVNAAGSFKNRATFSEGDVISQDSQAQTQQSYKTLESESQVSQAIQTQASVAILTQSSANISQNTEPSEKGDGIVRTTSSLNVGTKGPDFAAEGASPHRVGAPAAVVGTDSKSFATTQHNADALESTRTSDSNDDNSDEAEPQDQTSPSENNTDVTNKPNGKKRPVKFSMHTQDEQMTDSSSEDEDDIEKPTTSPPKSKALSSVKELDVTQDSLGSMD